MLKKLIVLLALVGLAWWYFLGMEQPLTAEVPSENGSVRVFFCPQDHCEQVLLGILGQAHSIQCALYSLKLPNVTRVLQEKNAGVLIDEDNFEGYGTKIVMPGLMHDKFCVLDNQWVWSGSFNPTKNGAYGENNNLVVIDSALLADNYAAKFEDIKTGKHNKVRYPKLYLNGFLVENYFCPEDDCEGHVLEALKTAQKNIYFLTFSFTSDVLGDFLISKKDSLEIMGVVEKNELNKYAEFYKFNSSGMRVRLDKSKYNMHHKVFIIDNETVVTGSYNPTSGGDTKNRENVLILHNPQLAMQFMNEFEKIWFEAGS